MAKAPAGEARNERRDDPRLISGTVIARHRRALCAALVAVSTLPPDARAEPLPLWEAGAGAAVVSLPHYRGADQGKIWVLPFPYLVYRGDFLKAEERRVRGVLFKQDRAEIDISVSAQPPVDSGESDSRRGMPDLDPVIEIGPSLNLSMYRSADRRTEVELRFPVRAAFATDFSYVDFTGWVFQPNVNADVRDPLGMTGWKFGVLGGLLFSNRRYNEYYYAVDPAFATPTRPAYNPSGGYAGSQVIAALSKRFPQFWIGGFVRWDTLDNAIFADSPLVRTEKYFAAGFAVAWIIGESKTRVDAPR